MYSIKTRLLAALAVYRMALRKQEMRAAVKPREWDFESPTSKIAQVAKVLARRGSISAIEIQTLVNTTDARKMVTTLRRKGLIGKSEKRTNKKTGISYMVHFSSGRKPTFKKAA